MRIRALFNAFLLLLPLSALAAHFDPLREFPNLFLPPQYRGIPADQVPAEVVKKSKKLVESALASMNRRMVVPIHLPGQTKTRPLRYLKAVQEEFKARKIAAKVLPSAGVLRSELTYLYDEIKKGEEARKPVPWDETLEAIADSTEDLPAGDFRSRGGDFDVFIQSDRSQYEAAQNVLLEVTNSAEKKHQLTEWKDASKRDFFTVGDAKYYSAQIARAESQGGSVVDLLAFDPEQGVIIDPPRFPGASDRVIQGYLDYAAPVSKEAVEDAAKQTIRGIRTRIELPWLNSGEEEVLRAELKSLLEQVSNRSSLTSKANEQFSKTIRNARYGAANNRFYRAAPGSVDALVFELTTKLQSKIPEFATFRNTHLAPDTKAASFPKELLMTKEEFIVRHTDHGKLFHGTPEVDNLFLIERQGLLLSRPSSDTHGAQGLGVYGRGAYTSKTRSVAESYAGSGGLVMELEVADAPLRILDWTPEVQASPFIQQVKKEAESAGRSVFEVLSTDYNIDIIVNHHVLIQNTYGFRFPKMEAQFLETVKNRLLGPKALLHERIQLIRDYSSLVAYLEDLGKTVKPLSTAEIEKLRYEVRNPIFYQTGDKGLLSRLGEVESLIRGLDPSGAAATFTDWEKHQLRQEINTVLTKPKEGLQQVFEFEKATGTKWLEPSQVETLTKKMKASLLGYADLGTKGLPTSHQLSEFGYLVDRFRKADEMLAQHGKPPLELSRAERRYFEKSIALLKQDVIASAGSYSTATNIDGYQQRAEYLGKKGIRAKPILPEEIRATAVRNLAEHAARKSGFGLPSALNALQPYADLAHLDPALITRKQAFDILLTSDKSDLARLSEFPRWRELLRDPELVKTLSESQRKRYLGFLLEPLESRIKVFSYGGDKDTAEIVGNGIKNIVESLDEFQATAVQALGKQAGLYHEARERGLKLLGQVFDLAKKRFNPKHHYIDSDIQKRLLEPLVEALHRHYPPETVSAFLARTVWLKSPFNRLHIEYLHANGFDRLDHFLKLDPAGQKRFLEEMISAVEGLDSVNDLHRMEYARLWREIETAIRLAPPTKFAEARTLIGTRGWNEAQRWFHFHIHNFHLNPGTRQNLRLLEILYPEDLFGLIRSSLTDDFRIHAMSPEEVGTLVDEISDLQVGREQFLTLPPDKRTSAMQALDQLTEKADELAKKNPAGHKAAEKLARLREWMQRHLASGVRPLELPGLFKSRLELPQPTTAKFVPVETAVDSIPTKSGRCLPKFQGWLQGLFNFTTKKSSGRKG